MRVIDRRTKVDRRAFLRGAAAAAPAAALAVVGATISAKAAWALDARALSPHQMATLVKVARDIYPHDRIADQHYVKAVQPWDEKAGKDEAVRAMLTEGVTRLDSDAAERFGGVQYMAVGWEADRVALLRGIEHTKFFRTVRADLVVSLYNQPEIWPKFGYEGSSAEYGGYLNRGFNDVDWLPTT